MFLTDSLARDAAPAKAVPRPMAWLALAASAVAMLAIGAVATVAILSGARPRPASLPIAFWMAFAAGALATCVSLGLRAVRWTFLLRRAGVRIPLRDACIAYLSGLSLLFVPLLVGEIVVRASIQKSRARVPLATTMTVNLWERFLDVAALSFIAALAVGLLAGPQAAVLPLTIVAVTATRSFRQFALSGIVAVANAAVRRAASGTADLRVADVARLTRPTTWLAALTASLVAWTLPGFALWAIAASLNADFEFVRAQFAYASATLTGALVLAPGGIRAVGTSIVDSLTSYGFAPEDAAVAVLALRLATAGMATLLGASFVWVHLRWRSGSSDSHFDEIAHAYDAQIPAAQRAALLARKTALMSAALTARGIGRRGLDAGCGQGWYVARMRQLGFDVHGIDTSSGQVARARRHVDDPGVISEGTVLDVNAADASYDFVYTINVLHHLPSEADQRAAFSELVRVLRPGGLLFLHEINTRNVLFRFYMGYVFPSLNCIDEGTERWLLPQRLADYTTMPVAGIEYFTFMPEFVPATVIAWLRPLERWLEKSRWRVFSAHYMAVLQKPVAGA